ncbi:hypothetical protein LSH36_1032g00054, partial [Paralvinella palmiformis]
LPQGAGNVALSRTSKFFKEFYCEFSIRAPSKRHRIMLTVNHLDIPETKGCKAGTLKIYDGPIVEKPIQLAGLCGNEVPQFSFRSNTDRITLAYHQALSIINRHKSFNLTFTYFRVTGPEHDCNNSREFPCVNGLCIPRVLECDGWNNCGDRTDENMDYHVCGKLLTTSDPMVGIAVGVTVASLLVIVMASLIAYGVQNKKGPFFHDNITMTTIQTSDVNGNTHDRSMTSRAGIDVTDDVTTALAESGDRGEDLGCLAPRRHNPSHPLRGTTRNPINPLDRETHNPMNGLLPRLDLDTDDVESVASSSELYAMGMNPPPPSYHSLFPDA